MEKILSHTSFNYLFGHLWEIELTYTVYMYIFAFKFTLKGHGNEADFLGFLHRSHTRSSFGFELVEIFLIENFFVQTFK